ncbi:12171_t:CDS:1, partial [Dentiscutata heterogama]
MATALQTATCFSSKPIIVYYLQQTYKTFQGLIWHENSAHRIYNQPPAYLISLPSQHIEQFKRLL